MPVTNFPEYARQMTDALNALVATGQAQLVSFEVDQRSVLRGFINGQLLFNDASELHFREFVDMALSEPRLMYAYHYQDANKALRFRYDNAAHRHPYHSRSTSIHRRMSSFYPHQPWLRLLMRF
jgi:hypothetical protein